MIIQAPAKINLGLFIKRRLPNGYHELETLLYPLDQPIDRLSIEASGQDTCTLSMSGRPIDGDLSDNLVVRAWEALKAKIPQLPGVTVHLSKRIPAGAGLGGGSADAAALLKGANVLFELNQSDKELAHIAATLGADIPFFIYQKPMLASGTGTTLEAFPLELSDYRIELFTPAIHSSTVAAYKGLDPKSFKPHRDLAAILKQPISTWRKDLSNDLEDAVFQKYPKLSRIKAELYSRGAVYAAMSGSGSAVFGLFER